MRPRPALRGKVPARLHRAAVRNFPVCCVDAVIHHRGRVLLVRRKEAPMRGLWWLPGGRLFKNERLEDAARRKAREEVGLDVEVVQRIGFYELWFPTGPAPNLADGYHNINVAFLVRPVAERGGGGPSDFIGSPRLLRTRGDLRRSGRPRGGPRIQPDSTMSSTRWVGRVEPGLDPYVRRVLRDAQVFQGGGRPVPDARVWSYRGRFADESQSTRH